MSDPFRGSRVAEAALAVLCAKVAVAVLLFDPRGFNPYSPTKALAEHALTFVLVGLLVALVLRHGRPALPWSPLHVPAAALGLAYVLATAFALDRRVALWGAEGRALGLATMVDSLVLYFGAVVLLRSERQLRWVGLAIAGVAILEVAYVAAQVLQLVPGVRGGGRPIGSAGNADPLGQMLASLTAGALGLAAAAGAPRNVRLVSAAIAAIAAAGWLMSGTRAPVVGLALVAVGLAAVWVLEATTSRSRMRRLVPAAALLLLATTAVALSPIGGRVAKAAGTVPALLAGDLRAVDKDLAGRLDHYRVSLEVGFDRPVLGVGPDNYTVAYPAHRLPGTRDLHKGYGTQTSNHSGVLKAFVDAGLTGLVAFIGLIAVGLRLAVRELHRPWVLAGAALLTSYVATSSVSINSVSTEWIPYLGLGLIAAPVGATIPVPGPGAGVRVGRRARARAHAPAGDLVRVGSIVAIAAGIVLAATASPAWQASRAAAEARRGLARGSGDDAARAALSAARSAVEHDPRRATYWTQLARALERVKSREALPALTRAAELEPFETANLVNLALAQIDLGRQGNEDLRRQAIETMRRAVAIDPYRPANRFTLGLALFENELYDEATIELERGLTLDDREVPGFGHETAARAYLRLGKPAEAERWCRLGLEGREIPRAREVTLRLLLARALIELGRPSDAIAETERVLAVDPENDDARRIRRDAREAQ